jgi:protoporphyrinogen IX oxidase
MRGEMHILTNVFLWFHFIGIGLAVGGGIALSQVGPKLVAAPATARGELWAFETFFGRVGAIGIAILVTTGPLMLWLKFGGPAGLGVWFWVKMTLVGVAIVGVGLHEWAGARFKRGDQAAVPLMFISGRLAGAAILLAILSAVITFN